VPTFEADFFSSSDLFMPQSQRLSRAWLQNRSTAYTSSASPSTNSEDLKTFLVGRRPWGRLDRFRLEKLQTKPNTVYRWIVNDNLGGSSVGFLNGRHILGGMLHGNAGEGETRDVTAEKQKFK